MNGRSEQGNAHGAGAWARIADRAATSAERAAARSGEPHHRHRPWIESLREMLEQAPVVQRQTGAPSPLDPERPLPFEEALVPLVSWAAWRLARDARCHLEGFTGDARVSLERGLLVRLCRACDRALYAVLSELRASRPADRATDDGHACYRQLVHDLGGAGLTALFVRYPALGRIVATIVDDWLAATRELLWRLDDDRAQLERCFANGQPLGAVDRVDSNLSDPHHGGRTVVALGFHDGPALVYKPRGLGLEAAFADVIGWIAARGELPAPAAARTLDRGTHGWMEAARRAHDRSPAETADDYRRAGALLCVLYVLGARDIHRGNVVAASAGPLLVDLETLLTPQPRDRREREGPAALLDTGFLPYGKRMLDGRLLDAGGIGAIAGDPDPLPQPRWRELNTDDMEPCGSDEGPSPTRNSSASSPATHVEAILEGYRAAYRGLVADRGLLAGPGSPWIALRRQTVRVVLRDTTTYLRLLDESLDPRWVADGAQRQAMLEAALRDRPKQLGTGRAVERSAPVGRSDDGEIVVGVELASLMRGDVPVFRARADGTDLLTEQGDTLAGWFGVSGWQAMVERLGALDERQLERHLDWIRTAVCLAEVGSRLDG